MEFRKKDMNMKKILLLTSVLLSGCATMQGPAKPVPPQSNRFLQELATSAKQAASYQQSVDAVTQAHVLRQVPPPPPSNLPGKMGMMLAFHWDGTLNGAVHALAKYTGMHVRIVGHAPIQPVMVYVHSNNTTVAKVLYDLGIQSGNDVGVVPLPSKNTIEIVYESKRKFGE